MTALTISGRIQKLPRQEKGKHVKVGQSRHMPKGNLLRSGCAPDIQRKNRRFLLIDSQELMSGAGAIRREVN